MKKITVFSALLFITVLSGYVIVNKTVSVPKDKVMYNGMNLVAPINELKKQTLLDLKANNVNTISLIPYAF